MRRYLGQSDPLGGYLPQLALRPEMSALFLRFWFALRRIDDLIDRHGFAALSAVQHELAAPRSGADFAQSLQCFLTGAEPWLDARRRVCEVAYTVVLERRAAARSSLPARDLLHLYYYKAYIPGYIGFRLMFPDEEETHLKTFTMLVSTALQLSDDLFDLTDDLRDGRFWITDEELQQVGATRVDCLRHLPAVTALRERICLTYHLLAHDCASRMRQPEDRRLAQRFVEYALLLHRNGHFHVAPGGNRGWERGARRIARAPGTERLKHRLFQTALAVLRRLRWLPVLDIDIAAWRRFLAHGPRCPDAQAPQVCLEIMRKLDASPLPVAVQRTWLGNGVLSNPLVLEFPSSDGKERAR